MRINVVVAGVACLGLINCHPSSGGSGTTAGSGSGSTSGSSSGMGLACASDQQCQITLDAGNCVDAGPMGAFCETCASTSECTSYGFSTSYVCKNETCVFMDAGPAAGTCNASCDCATAGDACVNNACAAPPAMCNADTDCKCMGICQSHTCIGTCNPDAGNANCSNPFPKCYAAFGYCSKCVTAADCVGNTVGADCLADGACGTAPATSSTSGSGSGATSGSGSGTGSGSGSSSGSTSGSPDDGGFYFCDPVTGSGCSSGQTCYCIPSFTSGSPCSACDFASACF